MKKNRDVLKFLIIFILMYGLISNFRVINKEILISLKMWANILIPSLFPYLVISGYVIRTGFPRFFNPIKKVTSNFFNISYASAEVFLCSLLCGYPCGGICASDIYKRGLIEKKEAERLICFTNGASPVFLICAVGGVMLGNIGLGIVMYAVQTISSVTVGFILGIFSEKNHFSKKPNPTHLKSASLTQCCENSVVTIVNIAGYIIVATAVGETVIYLISSLFAYSLNVKYVVYYFLEISKAMKLLSEFGTSDINFALMCACASLGGVSVIMQIFGVIDESLKSIKIIIARFFGAILSFFLGLFLKGFESITFSGINPYVPVFVSLMASVIIFILFSARKKQTNL